MFSFFHLIPQPSPLGKGDRLWWMRSIFHLVNFIASFSNQKFNLIANTFEILPYSTIRKTNNAYAERIKVFRSGFIRLHNLRDTMIVSVKFYR